MGVEPTPIFSSDFGNSRDPAGLGLGVAHVATLLLGQYTAFYDSQDGCYRRDRQTDGHPTVT